MNSNQQPLSVSEMRRLSDVVPISTSSSGGKIDPSLRTTVVQIDIDMLIMLRDVAYFIRCRYVVGWNSR